MKVQTNEALAVLAENILGKLPEVPEIPAPEIEDGRGDEETMVLLLSDLQAGHKTLSFNRDVLRCRIAEYMRASVKIAKLHRKAYPIRHCHVFWLGDNIQNEIVGKFVSLDELEMVVMEQVFGTVVPYVTVLFKHLLKHFETLTVHCVRGNHGLVSKDAAETTNWDSVIHRIVADKFRNHKRITFAISDSFYQIAEVCGWKFLLLHGDQIPFGSYGVPLYGVIQRMMRYASGGIAESFDYVVMGHFHCYSNMDWNNLEVIINGTFVSDDEYVKRRMGLASSTCQVAFGVHVRRGITWRYKIQLNRKGATAKG